MYIIKDPAGRNMFYDSDDPDEHPKRRYTYVRFLPNLSVRLSYHNSIDGKIRYNCIQGEDLNKCPEIFRLIGLITNQKIEYRESKSPGYVRKIEWWDYLTPQPVPTILPDKNPPRP